MYIFSEIVDCTVSETAEEEHPAVDLELLDLYPEIPASQDTHATPCTSDTTKDTELGGPTLRSVISAVQSTVTNTAPVVTTPALPTPPPPPTTAVAGQSTQLPEMQTEKAVPQLDQDILDLLGETPSKEKALGPKIHNDLSVRWNHILTSGLQKETRKELLEKYLIPENCTNIDAPVLNPETKAALSEILLKKDKSLETKQKQRAAAISCLGQALTRLLEVGIKDAAIIRPLLDAARLTCDLQHTDSLIRRSFICSTLKKEVKDRLYATEIDKFLFSEKLPDILKAGKAIQKSGAEMKVSTYKAKKQNTSNRPLNSRPPLPTGRTAAGVSRKQDPAPAATRRRAPHPPPPAAPAHTRQPPRSQTRAPRNR